MLLGWLVIEAVMPDLKNCHIIMFCYNILTVARANRLDSKRSMPAGRLLHVLELLQRRSQFLLLLTLYIAGEKNDMEDVAS